MWKNRSQGSLAERIIDPPGRAAVLTRGASLRAPADARKEVHPARRGGVGIHGFGRGKGMERNTSLHGLATVRVTTQVVTKKRIRLLATIVAIAALAVPAGPNAGAQSAEFDGDKEGGGIA